MRVRQRRPHHACLRRRLRSRLVFTNRQQWNFDCVTLGLIGVAFVNSAAREEQRGEDTFLVGPPSEILLWFHGCGRVCVSGTCFRLFLRRWFANVCVCVCVGRWVGGCERGCGCGAGVSAYLRACVCVCVCVCKHRHPISINSDQCLVSL